jgi:transposase
MGWKKGRARNETKGYERYLEVHAKYGETHTNLQIAGMLGVSLITVERYNRKAGIKKAAPYKGFPARAITASEQYLLENNRNLTNAEAAELLGITPKQIIKWRKELGLSVGHTGKWCRAKHPKGYLGHTHGEEARAKISKTSKAAWANPNSKLNSDEVAQKRSDNLMRRQNENRIQNYSRCAAGKRADLGDYYFRSAWEANYARYLNWLKANGEIADWKYEPDTFWFEAIRRGTRSYKPDFKIFHRDGTFYYIEIKGWMDAKSQTKLKRMAKYHPHVKIELVQRKDYLALRRCVEFIPLWEWDATMKRGIKIELEAA